MNEQDQDIGQLLALKPLQGDDHHALGPLKW